jgi:hypothetical protein
MPDRRVHRGPHSEDHKLFAQACVPALRAATCDLSWLLLAREVADGSTGDLMHAA